MISSCHPSLPRVAAGLSRLGYRLDDVETAVIPRAAVGKVNALRQTMHELVVLAAHDPRAAESLHGAQNSNTELG